MSSLSEHLKSHAEELAAFWVFVLAGVTDALDGFLARVLKQKTEFGAFIDPIADKLLLITSYVTLAVLGVLPKWLTVPPTGSG